MFKTKITFLIIFIIYFLYPSNFSFAALSCSITTKVACTGTVILRMSGSSNAHAELPSGNTNVYDNNVVCCTGGTGLSNSCSDNNKVVFAKLSGTTNAHAEQNTQSNYSQNACISSTYAGDQITLGYQSSSCSGYDTTLFSMSNTPTNSQVGGPSAYTNKVCATITTQSITFSISDTSIGFGYLSPSGLRYATGDTSGSASETEAHHIDISTNASSGYSLYIKGETLKNGSISITPIGGTNMTPSPGTKAFGVRAVASGGVGTVVSPYDGAGFAYDATGSNSSMLGTATSGNGVSTSYSIRSVATIDSILDSGDYSTNITYIIVPNF